MAKKLTSTAVTAQKVVDLYNSQIDEWDMLRDNYGIYDGAPREDKIFDSVFWKVTKILLSYRKASLSADLKAIDKGERPCFLCLPARPVEQKALPWEGYEILVNPYPASDVHFTIVSNEHTPQRLGQRITDMARLTRIIPGNCIFYNGPRCGASAPDHMHFQAVDISEAENLLVKTDYLIKVLTVGRSALHLPRPNIMPYGCFILDIKNDRDIMPMYNLVMSALPATDVEPMINVAALKMSDTTRIVIMPRKNHRPQCYGTGEGQLLVSPASLEMMGKFITSRREDFDSLDEQSILRIYSEVAYTHEEFTDFINRLPQ